MSNSNFRCKDYDTVHHLTNRIAHRVFFLAEDERNDLMEIVLRSSEFCGIRILAWCIMTNHFHLLVHLPVRPTDIPEDDVLRRYEILKGRSQRIAIERQIDTWRTQGDGGRQRAITWFDRQRARMYNVGEFMKLVKQWFTEEYNRRQSHVGTLWESAYYDRVVEYRISEIAKCAGYIHLNPIRAALCSGFSEYPWSSFTALSRGDATALDGMRFAYDSPDASASDLIARHTELLDKLLEKEKLCRAEDIARKRMAGYEVPLDPLTSEALVAQAMSHLKLVQKAGVALKEESAGYRKSNEKRQMAQDRILELMGEDPYIQIDQLAENLNLPKSTVYRYLKEMQNRCEIYRLSATSPWSILKLGLT